jgi:hypothetical protein
MAVTRRKAVNRRQQRNLISAIWVTSMNQINALTKISEAHWNVHTFGPKADIATDQNENRAGVVKGVT